MSNSKLIVAVCYDFDGTLTAMNMQEYAFLPKLKLNKRVFWDEVNKEAKACDADSILVYMKAMLDKAKIGRVSVRRKDFIDFGKSIKFYKGVEQFFNIVNAYANSKDIILEHYIISSGLKEMIEGTSISREFKKIYASSFIYDENGVAVWPALAVNYTTKTQFLFRVNKGVLDISDDSVNNFIAHDKRRISFKNIIYIGDGKTDAPCFKLVKEYNGHSVAVYDKDKTEATRLYEENRVNYICKADYSERSPLVEYIKSVIDKAAADDSLARIESKLTKI